MTALQKTIITATVAVLAGAGIYETRQASQLREQHQTLQQQQASLAEQVERLESERDDAKNRLAVMHDDLDRVNSNSGELLKLRGEVRLLRREAERSKGLNQSNRDTTHDGAHDLPDDPVLRNRIFIRQMVEGRGSDGKTLAFHARLFADSNNGWLPTNWQQVAKFENEYPTTGTNSFEFVHTTPLNLNQLGANFERTVLVREYLPWKDLDENWNRVYGYADGHSQVVQVPDGNFTKWEEQNTYIPAK